ncbi:elongation factor P maturation arginine rhamnosyltransferase EarP [Chitiniphilus eburneus]|uniref:elongation factor P maturation arginine rhamnosyltransferase EarP n=1 Tax=Chitiniphilus eburneus TaxID=2571148 RepID=UPI001FE602BE|nr:elongation factor P maturation arginine rhamnosyltransferase EarP [Chitiniphilus eburneus]
MNATRPLAWDVFCQVVDNYGDIGVCWRLARQLAALSGHTVRLWVDDLHSFAPLLPALDPAQPRQRHAGVDILHWREADADALPGDVVIEAFACALPAAWPARMRARRPSPLWINLEYLSAEDWVAGCHGLMSPQPGGLGKYFFFPGFTDATGGLPRERDLLSRRAAWDDTAARGWLAARLGVTVPPDALRISLFAYQDPPLAPLLDAWAASAQPVWLLAPQGKVTATLASELGVTPEALAQGVQRGALTARSIPFVEQDEYDLLLWSCHLNFVRGEDSFVRAQWAGVPLVWHIYPQEDAAHLDKLAAFLALYLAELPAEPARALRAFWLAWNAGGTPDWAALAPGLPALRDHAARWAAHLGGQRDLAANLVSFARAKLE